jgi:hypothetical protein
MLYDMDLLKGQTRYDSQKFLRVWCNFEPNWLEKAESWELAVVLATPGFAYDHHCWAFAWNWTMRDHVVPKLIAYWADDPSVQRAARANAESITMEDGLDYLQALLETKRGYGGSVPLWTTLALQGLRDGGMTAAEIAKRFRTTSERVTKWWSERRFDPLTGLELPVVGS